MQYNSVIVVLAAPGADLATLESVLLSLTGDDAARARGVTAYHCFRGDPPEVLLGLVRAALGM